MRQTTREFSVVGAWPKGITVGNWREGGWAAHSSILYDCRPWNLGTTTAVRRRPAST